MRARVTRAYTDRVDGSVHYPNTTVELTDERAAELSARGFVEPAPGAAAPPAEEPATDLDAMTAAQLRDLIAGRGGSAPKRATKAQLLEIAGAL